MAEVSQELGNDLTITEHVGERTVLPDEMRLYSHSTVFYWWPVWVVGFVMSAITWFWGEPVIIGLNPAVRIHPNAMLGFGYAVVIFLVFIFTNVTMRGLASGMLIMAIALVSILFAYLDWWDDILFLLPDITIFMNLGFYLFMSITVFVSWALAYFVFDRLTYYRIKPGQMTIERVIGGGEQSFDTTGLVFEEMHQDFFKHYLLGFGSSDLKLSVRGARQVEFYLPNVLFAHRKVIRVQELIKRKPE